MLESLSKAFYEHHNTIKTCNSEEEKIEILKDILECNYSPYIPMFEAQKKFNIKKHTLVYSIETEKIKAIKIGRRVLIKTSTIASIIYSKNKNLF